MKKIIAFNWKMNPTSTKEAEKISKLISGFDVIVFPPFIYLETLKLKKAKLGAQNLFWDNPPRQLAGDKGAYTGEISASMLKNLGVDYVIIGHSERRKWQGETDEIINKKIKVAVKAGLKIILCVGESSQIRKKGLKSVKTFIKTQLWKDLKQLQTKLIIAYEPIWAIGTGNFCKSKDALEIIKFIKSFLNSKFKIQNSKLLYGGSVDSKNILDFIKHKEIDGVLVGGASVNIKELKKMLSLI